jgi:Tfp pilus assembly protein PilO
LADLFEFFKRLQALDRLIRIEQVKLTNDPDFSGQVTMETRVVIYYAAQAEQG